MMRKTNHIACQGGLTFLLACCGALSVCQVRLEAATSGETLRPPSARQTQRGEEIEALLIGADAKDESVGLEVVNRAVRPQIRAVVFDFDGTLANTLELSFAEFNHLHFWISHASSEDPPPGYAEGRAFLEATMGTMWNRQTEIMMQQARGRGHTNGELRDVLGRLAERYDVGEQVRPLGDDELALIQGFGIVTEACLLRYVDEHSPTLLPGVREFLEHLHLQQIPMYVGTAGLRHLIERIIEKAGIRHYFRAIYGNEIAGAATFPKGKGQMLQHVAEELELGEAQLLMIGDGQGDMRAKVESGIPDSVVVVGLHRGEAQLRRVLREAGADYLAPSLEGWRDYWPRWEPRIVKPFGQTGMEFFPLGLGTIWFGRRWPPNNTSYGGPDPTEIDLFLFQAFERMGNRDGVVMLDTAAAYGLSEERIGHFLQTHPQFRDKAFIATKWGEEFDLATERSRIDHSLANLHASVARSGSTSGKLICSISTARHSPYYWTRRLCRLQRMKATSVHGIRWLGASISNKEVFAAAVEQGLLDMFDVIQIPAWLFRERQDLAGQLHRQGKAIVLNSPIRNIKGQEPQPVFAELLNDASVSMVLVGTRNHLTETIGYVTTPTAPADWQQQVHDSYRDATIAVIGGSGFVGGAFLERLGHTVAEVGVVRALTRDVSRLRARLVGSSLAQKLAPSPGDHLNVEDLRRVMTGAKLIVDTAGLAWQHPHGHHERGPHQLLIDELLQNGMSAALLGALLAPDQRLVWTSSNALDGMLNRLGADARAPLIEEVDARARRFIAHAQDVTRGSASSRIDALEAFVRRDLTDHPPAAFPKSQDDPQRINYAEAFSYAYSKFVGQRVLEMLGQERGKNICVLKISDVYGPGQSLGEEILDPATPARRLQRFLAVYEAVRTGQYQPWIDNQHGFRRDKDVIQQLIWNDYVAPTYIDDVVEMLLRASVAHLPPRKVVLDVSAPWLTNAAMTTAVKDAVQLPQHVELVTSAAPASAPPLLGADLSMLGLSSESLTPLADGMQQHLTWWKNFRASIDLANETAKWSWFIGNDAQTQKMIAFSETEEARYREGARQLTLYVSLQQLTHDPLLVLQLEGMCRYRYFAQQGGTVQLIIVDERATTTRDAIQHTEKVFAALNEEFTDAAGHPLVQLRAEEIVTAAIWGEMPAAATISALRQTTNIARTEDVILLRDTAVTPAEPAAQPVAMPSQAFGLRAALRWCNLPEEERSAAKSAIAAEYALHELRSDSTPAGAAFHIPMPAPIISTETQNRALRGFTQRILQRSG